ncbi:hypothetical protein GOY17_01720 [Lysobacter soli]|uniref:hypothetical protein n=1 Tax=Lysobacter soli TaxID=453783 RepID=UPI0012EED332|nr:hypothetical protein [Lysobacter soli]QGW63744.1 hypothetical protein GOY17_01720 [Lysobacter soli]
MTASDPKQTGTQDTRATSKKPKVLIRVQAWIEFAIGGTLAALAIVLFANARLCFFNQSSCGMVEPIAGMYALALALPLLIAGWLHRSGWSFPGNLAYLPLIAAALFLYGQAHSWW